MDANQLSPSPSLGETQQPVEKTPAKEAEDFGRSLRELVSGVNLESLPAEDKEYLKQLGQEFIALQAKADEAFVSNAGQKVAGAPNYVVLTPTEAQDVLARKS